MRCCGATWPRLSAERSRVAGAPRGPGSGRPSRPRRRWGSGAQARSRRRHARRFVTVAVFRRWLQGRRVPGSRLSPRSTRGRRMMGLRGTAFQCIGARSRTAADAPAEWPRPRPRQGRPGRPEDGRNTETLRSAHGLLQTNNRPAAAFRGVPRRRPGVEVGAGLQHRMQDHRQLAGQRDRGALEAEPLPQRQSPSCAASLSPRTRVSIAMAAS